MCYKPCGRERAVVPQLGKAVTCAWAIVRRPKLPRRTQLQTACEVWKCSRGSGTGKFSDCCEGRINVPLETISRFTFSDPTRAGTAAGAHQTREICQSRLRYGKCSVLERLMQDTLLRTLDETANNVFVPTGQFCRPAIRMVSTAHSVLPPKISLDAV